MVLLLFPPNNHGNCFWILLSAKLAAYMVNQVSDGVALMSDGETEQQRHHRKLSAWQQQWQLKMRTKKKRQKWKLRPGVLQIVWKSSAQPESASVVAWPRVASPFGFPKVGRIPFSCGIQFIQGSCANEARCKEFQMEAGCPMDCD